MKKQFPIILALFSILIFVGLILKHEDHLQNSQSIYIELAQVDPRSMLQGDYMALNYELYLAGLREGNPWDENRARNKKQEVSERQIQNQSKILSYVQLDAQRRVIQTNFDQNQLKTNPENTVRLVLKNPSNQLQNLYPAANSFLFAEGLEPCYRNAKYAELRVKPDGQVLLAGLVDEDLNSLNCESQTNWIKGS